MITDELKDVSGLSSTAAADYAAKGYHYLHETAAEALPAVAAIFRDGGYHLEHITGLDMRADDGVMCLVYQFNRYGAPERHVFHVKLGVIEIQHDLMRLRNRLLRLLRVAIETVKAVHLSRPSLRCELAAQRVTRCSTSFRRCTSAR